VSFVSCENNRRLLAATGFAASALLTSLALTACGGGGDSGSTPPASPPAAATPTAPPAPTITTPATAATAGTLQMLGFNGAATTTQGVSITGSGNTSVMTFVSPSFTLTGAVTSSPVWSANGGRVRASGNVVSYCSAGSKAAYGSGDTPYQQGQYVYFSANLTAVTDITELRGHTFYEFSCAATGTNYSTAINSDGSLTRIDQAGTATLTAAQAAQFFSAAGFIGTDGNNYKVRAYKVIDSGATRYFLVNPTAQPTANFVTLADETAP
jgi:hypothetical protein